MFILCTTDFFDTSIFQIQSLPVSFENQIPGCFCLKAFGVDVSFQEKLLYSVASPTQAIVFKEAGLTWEKRLHFV
jgi:hypothetical protein